ncbi:MAG TPA: hypothetical protein VGG33_09290 [Polyangia bacterium]
MNPPSPSASSATDDKRGDSVEPVELRDPAWLERLRTSGIRIDRQGQFIHEGEPVLHEGMRRAFFRWLDRLPDGRYVLRLDEKRYAYLDVEDTPLVATSLRWQGDRAYLGLNDGREEPLDPATLNIDSEGVLRARVREGRLEARLATDATTVLAERIAGSGPGAQLSCDGKTTPIPARA